MDAVTLYNIIEFFLWLGFAVVFFIPALRRDEKHRLFCALGGLGFVAASLSELVEVRTGAWWRPWWLLLWKASFFPYIAFMVVWYTRFTPDWRQKLFGKNKQQRHSELDKAGNKDSL
jgi:hypothetical protein